MNRSSVAAFCAAFLVWGLSGCQQQYVRNCPIIGADPNSNLYNLDYKLVIPADCPIPLASPGSETKYAAANITDLNGVDMEWARIEVKNSKGVRVATGVTAFTTLGNTALAVLKEEYTAATGASSFSDYDMAKFVAWHSMTGKSATGTTKLTYQQTTLSTRLTGEGVPQPYTNHTWNAPATGGHPGFTYQWFVNGNPAGTGTSFTASVDTSDFDLRVEVTDQTWSTVAAVLAVDVGGVEGGITGPVILREGERGTWTANGRGGTGTYTFDWYLDDRWVGSSTTLLKAPAAGSHELRLEVRDGAGEYDSQTIFVTVNPAPCPNGARVC